MDAVLINAIIPTQLEKNEMRDTYKRNRIGSKFVNWAIHKGYFCGLVSRQQIERFNSGKHLSKEHNVHHILPISGGGTNSFSNFTYIEKNYHHWLHKNIYDIYLHDRRAGEHVSFYVPRLKTVEYHMPSSKELDRLLTLNAEIRYSKNSYINVLTILQYNDWRARC